MEKALIVTKASGEEARFDAEKLLGSLRRSGASYEQSNDILTEVMTQYYPGIPTKTIYRIAFGLLKQRTSDVAARYHLKQAIMELGPSGFPFEQYIGELLRHQGYRVKTGQILPGRCVNHEIDVQAENAEGEILVECKYHNHQGISSDVKIPLYIDSRFRDIAAWRAAHPGKKDAPFKGWVVTNTRFTGDAIQYGSCAGLKLVGWDYPVKTGLKRTIDALALYPVTCLTALTRAEKQRLLDRGNVLCRDVDGNEKLLRAIGIKGRRLAHVLLDARKLCTQPDAAHQTSTSNSQLLKR